MKALILSMLWRNALVALAFLLLLSCEALVSNFIWPPPWFLILIAFFCGLLWANSVLFRNKRPVLAVVISFVLVPALGFPVAIGARMIGSALVEWKYSNQGFQVVEGCNGGASIQADFEVHDVQRLLGELAETPNADTDGITQLQKILVLAQEKARVLGDDCRWRGHRDTHPWKTNWATCRRDIEAAQQRIYR